MMIFLPEFLFILLRSPCKNLKPYDNPFWGLEQRYQEQENKRKQEKEKLPKIVAYLSCSAGRTHFARTVILNDDDFHCYWMNLLV